MTQDQTVHRGRGFAGIRAVLAGVAVLVGVSLSLSAQIATGGITGTVTDSSGAKIVGATITLTNTSTGVAARAISTSTGTYVFNAVLAGTYSLQATQKGFKTYIANGIEIHV